MALKLWQKNRWSGNKQHKDGLNTDRDMAYSSERETTNSKFRLGTYMPPPHQEGLNNIDNCSIIPQLFQWCHEPQ